MIPVCSVFLPTLPGRCWASPIPYPRLWKTLWECWKFAPRKWDRNWVFPVCHPRSPRPLFPSPGTSASSMRHLWAVRSGVRPFSIYTRSPGRLLWSTSRMPFQFSTALPQWAHIFHPHIRYSRPKSSLVPFRSKQKSGSSSSAYRASISSRVRNSLNFSTLSPPFLYYSTLTTQAQGVLQGVLHRELCQSSGSPTRWEYRRKTSRLL